MSASTRSRHRQTGGLSFRKVDKTLTLRLAAPGDLRSFGSLKQPFSGFADAATGPALQALSGRIKFHFAKSVQSTTKTA